MRWVLYIIVLYAVVALQTTVAPLLAVQTVRPDLLALLAIHAALAAPPLDGPLAACAAGLAVDLSGLSYGAHANVGVATLSYGVVGLAIVRIRKFTFRDHALTYFVFTLLGTTLIHLLSIAHMLYVTGQPSRWPAGLLAAVGTGVYTAALSPYAHWLLRRARMIWGIAPARTLRAR